MCLSKILILPLSKKLSFSLILALLCLKAIGQTFPGKVDSDGISRWHFQISRKQMYISGILAIRTVTHEECTGTMLNEFGIKAFDFEYHQSSEKVKLFNMVKMLDKWYIKMILKRDISFLFMHGDETIKSKKYNLYHNKDSIRLINNKYNIEYVIASLSEKE